MNPLDVIPEKYRGWALFFLAVSPYITRACHALMNGRGIKGTISAIWLGTNTPKSSTTANPDKSTSSEKDL